jgi:hypothetical protein
MYIETKPWQLSCYSYDEKGTTRRPIRLLYVLFGIITDNIFLTDNIKVTVEPLFQTRNLHKWRGRGYL